MRHARHPEQQQIGAFADAQTVERHGQTGRHVRHRHDQHHGRERHVEAHPQREEVLADRQRSLEQQRQCERNNQAQRILAVGDERSYDLPEPPAQPAERRHQNWCGQKAGQRQETNRDCDFNHGRRQAHAGDGERRDRGEPEQRDQPDAAIGDHRSDRLAHPPMTQAQVGGARGVATN